MPSGLSWRDLAARDTTTEAARGRLSVSSCIKGVVQRGRDFEEQSRAEEEGVHGEGIRRRAPELPPTLARPTRTSPPRKDSRASRMEAAPAAKREEVLADAGVVVSAPIVVEIEAEWIHSCFPI